MNSVFSIMFVLMILNCNAIAQTIYPEVFGQNAWMPDSIGSNVYNGKLHSVWPKVANSGTRTVRFGGIAADRDDPSFYQYLKLVDSLRLHGLEPLMQVPFYNNKFTAEHAASIVNYLNIVHNRNVRYWVIGNEPDNSYGYVNSAQVAPYIKEFASAMKAIDPSIKLIGPETAWYNPTILDGLTNPGGPYDITGKDESGNFYIDVISFHSFPFSGRQRRNEIIEYLGEKNSFRQRLVILNERIKSCNLYHNRTGDDLLTAAITEANINWKNAQHDDLNGVSASSFIAGQYWAELIGVALKNKIRFLNFWSTIEGNELGYLDQVNSLPKPTYHHFKMIADNMNGGYCDGKDNNSNIKTFGSKNENEISVVIMNQDQFANFSYLLKLDTASASTNKPLVIYINAGISVLYEDEIPKESTVILVFNSSGQLIKKCLYRLSDEATAGSSPTCLFSEELPEAVITAAGPTNFCKGGNVLLSANNGDGLNYQWRKNGESITGETNSIYQANMSGNYSVQVSNAIGTSTSNIISVTVVDSVASISISTPDTSICQGIATSFSAQVVNGGTSPVFQWKINESNVGVNSPTFSSTNLSDQDKVLCVLTSNQLCTENPQISSNSITMNITVINAVISALGPTTFKPGGSVVLQAQIETGSFYQWYNNGRVISGEINSSYTAKKSGDYKVKITKNDCSAFSNSIKVMARKN